MKKHDFKIVLYQPEIPGNTGSIGRTCVALDIPLILIGPYGFDINEKSVRRAGLDYWKYLQLEEYDSWGSFLEIKKPKDLLFFENDQSKNFFQAPYEEGCYLVFGSETKGISPNVLNEHSTNIYSVPMFSDEVRSLNLSNVATTVAYQCLYQLDF